MNSAGAQTEDSYDYWTVSRSAGHPAMVVTGRERGRRVGDCPAGKDEAANAQ